MENRSRWIRAVLAMGSLTAAVGVSAASSNANGSFERTFKVTGPVEIVVTAESSDFKVRAGDASEVRVLGRVHAESKWQTNEAVEKALREIEANPPIQQEGNVIRIGWSDTRKPSQASVDYELVVPPDTQWRSVAGSGDLWISGIRGPVDIKTDSGDIRLEAVKGAIHARTGSGDVLVENSGSEQIEIETESGDVQIRLPKGVGCDLTAQTSSGDISAPDAFTVEARMPHSEVHVKVRGGGFPVKVRTGSGNIRID